jgi:hypothetical protein
MRIEVRTAVEATAKNTVDLDVGREYVEDDAVGLGYDLAEVVLDGFGGVEAVASEAEEATVSPQAEEGCEVGGSGGAKDVGGVAGGGGFLEGLDDAVQVSV